MCAFLDDPTSVFNASTIENNYKIAEVLQIRNEIPKAIKRYQDVCLALERITNSNPGAQSELRFAAMSLGKLSEIYQKKEDFDKALAFARCQRGFLEFIANNKPNQEDECSTDGGEAELPEHKLEDLWEQMHAAIDMADAPPPKDPQEVVQLFLEAKKKQDAENARRNMEMLNQIMEEKKKKLETSRWEQTLEWINQHPIKLAISAVVFLGVFLAIALSMFDFEQLDPSRDMRRLREQAAENQRLKREQEGNTETGHEHHHHHHHSDQKMSAEDMQKFQEMVEELKKQQAQREQEIIHKKNLAFGQDDL